MEDIDEFHDNISVDEEPVKIQQQASNGGQGPNEAGADDAEDLAGTNDDHREDFSPAEETTGSVTTTFPTEITGTTTNVGAVWMYPGGVSQGHAFEEGNDNGDDAVVDAVADITDIVEAALVDEGVYDALVSRT
mmetsp:Transcript_13883/g.20556  ORF Transcript_13883/g.20556 Transcript_13883/m.20556 type:complete len:134 (-) Transcript_13883:1529-1930(-)